MSFNNEWEEFYTDSLNDENLVDYISINTRRKKYILYNDVDDIITESVNENDEYEVAMYVSRTIFDIILSGVKEKKYTRMIDSNE